MASSLAKAAAAEPVRQGLFGGKARHFYYEVCRCLPFIHRTMRLEEIVTVADLRAVVNSKFKRFKDVKDPKAVDLLIFKGREELECYLLIHKQRHHVITEYLEGIIQKKRNLPKEITGHTEFLDSFLTTNTQRLTGQ